MQKQNYRVRSRAAKWTVAALLAAVAVPAGAQPRAPMGQGPGQPGQQQPPANPADQLVGLFGATCMHFGGDVRGLRGFLTQQGAPVMPAQARDAFLAGRTGQVFDVSVPGVNLALVSLDDGGCEAVAEKASGSEVLGTLQQAAREAGATMTPLGAQSDAGPNGVQHSAYQLVVNGKQMHVLVSTAPAAPQAVITLAPK
jgi:hypothetical protein